MENKQDYISQVIRIVFDYAETFKDPNQQEQVNNRAKLNQQYYKIIDSKHYDNLDKNQSSQKCPNEMCQSTRLMVEINESQYVCQDCDCILPFITDNEKPSYKEPPKEVCYFSYKRENRFIESLNQVQGKESTEIPQEVYDEIKNQLNKERIYDYSKVSQNKIRQILKILHFSKYQEHISIITYRITGKHPHMLTPDQINQLRMKFRQLQSLYSKYCPADRKNFLSYTYVCHKLLEHMNLPEQQAQYKLLKSPEKLHYQDKIWKDICQDLNWKFIKSI